MTTDSQSTVESTDGSFSMSGSMPRWKIFLLAGIAFVVATLGALLMLVVAIVTLFQARRFYCEGPGRGLARFALWLCGVKMIVHHNGALPTTQTVYVSNHTSTLDVFLLLALGLPNTRFFMYGKLRRVFPVGVIGYLIGNFWTVDQCFSEQRRRIFERAARVLKRTGESVYLSPEGQRVLSGEIGHFNKGSFHMATDLKVPVQPFYIHIPKSMNPGLNLIPNAGTVEIYFMPTVSTEGWKLEELDKNRAHVRDMFVRFHEQMRGK
jgi:1-acyl-sn-glycerol-3-phosphate acyltransferase